MKKVHIDLELNLADDIADSISENMGALKSDLEYYFEQKNKGSSFIARETLEDIVDEMLSDTDTSNIAHGAEITVDSMRELLLQVLPEVIPEITNIQVQDNKETEKTESSKEPEQFNSADIITFDNDSNTESDYEDSPFTAEELEDFGDMFNF